MKQPFATNNKLGLPLVQPSAQTLLPIICGGNGNIQGFYPITKTTFTGSETSYTLSDGPVPITTVTLPQKVSDGTGTQGVPQYMAAVWPDDEEHDRPWIGYSDFVPIGAVGYLGADHKMPTQGWGTAYYLGTLVTNLKFNMDELVPIPPTTTPPSVTPATLRWVTSVEAVSLDSQCPFIDFNWVTLFKASSPNVDPLRIDVISNPAGGFFKSTLVANPVVSPLGGTYFDTVRLIRLLPAPAGTYTFQYAVTDTQNNVTQVTLTLTVV